MIEITLMTYRVSQRMTTQTLARTSQFKQISEQKTVHVVNMNPIFILFQMVQ